MSCYLRRLEDVLLAAGVRHTGENRGRIHAVIQEMTGERGCPSRVAAGQRDADPRG